ncbi:Ig-like domain-containing protein [Actinomadura miaoliensis]|uniref:Uncharacterized protein n=1 Tax=Actinomadura miaoliensis TaxID=430685 RepID=A0ABP7X1H0_9ACTN
MRQNNPPSRSLPSRALAGLAAGTVAAVMIGASPVTAVAAGDGAPACIATDEIAFRGQPLTWHVSDLCEDPDGDPMTIVGVRTQGEGTATHSTDTVTFQGEVRPGYSAQVDVTVSDGAGQSVAELRISHVDPAIGTPVDDSYTVRRGQKIIFDVRDNDQNAAGNGVWIMNGPYLGDAQSNDDGTITYTAADLPGSDTFEYFLTNPANGNQSLRPARVTIKVTQ